MAASTSSVLWAEWRRGLKDLQNAVINAWNGVTPTHEEAGSIANPTQQVITNNIQGKEDFKSMTADYASRPTAEREQQQLER